MKNNHLKKLALILLLPSSFTQANEPGFYAGLGVGIVNIESPETTSDFFLPGQKLDDEAKSASIYVGYQLNKNVSFELGSTDLGSVKKVYELNPDIQTLFAANQTLAIDAEKTFINAKLQYPFYDKFNLFGLIGYTFYDINYKHTGGLTPSSNSESKEDFSFGLGSQYRFNDKLSGRLQWTRETPGDLEINNYQALVEMSF